MGKIFQGILGGLTGRVGNVVGSSWKGIPVLKTRPLSVANPRTSGQVQQRSRMRQLVDIASPALGAIIKPLWDRHAQKMSGFNAFIKWNITRIFTGSVADYSLLSISNGRMSPTAFTSANVTMGGTQLGVQYPTTINDNYQQADDIAYVLVIDVNGEVVGLSDGTKNRGDAGFPLSPLPGKTFTAGDNVYLAFRRPDGFVQSGTMHTLAT